MKFEFEGSNFFEVHPRYGTLTGDTGFPTVYDFSKGNCELNTRGYGLRVQ